MQSHQTDETLMDSEISLRSEKVQASTTVWGIQYSEPLSASFTQPSESGRVKIEHGMGY